LKGSVKFLMDIGDALLKAGVDSSIAGAAFDTGLVLV
jgi:hypothetical protein